MRRPALILLVGFLVLVGFGVGCFAKTEAGCGSFSTVPDDSPRAGAEAAAMKAAIANTAAHDHVVTGVSGHHLFVRDYNYLYDLYTARRFQRSPGTADVLRKAWKSTYGHYHPFSGDPIVTIGIIGDDNKEVFDISEQRCELI